jgi:DNA-binding transcriptional MerR regulator
LYLPSNFPGTVVPISTVELLTGIFTATNGITLSQVCEITGLEPGTVQNWIKRGYVNPPVGRKYSKNHMARIILINLLRDTFVIERIADLLSHINGDLLDRSDDIMDDSEIYQCLCDILITKDKKVEADADSLSGKIDNRLKGFQEPYPGAKDKLKLALRAMVYACLSAEYKRVANQLTEHI